MQDAAFVVAPPGKTNSSMKDRGRDQPSTRNEDGSWSKKGDKSYFGYKKHIKTCLKTGIIKEVAVTTARTADCSLDLTEQTRQFTETEAILEKQKQKAMEV